MDQQLGDVRVRREPIFNVPTAVVATLAVLVLVHVVREWVLTQRQDAQLLLWFAFIPARYDAAVTATAGDVAGLGPQIWTFFTYALIHGDWTHLGLNSVWLLAFGTPIARRFGAMRFLAFFVLTAAAGAAAHLATHAHAYIPVIGASASISGFMAAAIRFVFQRSGPLGSIGRNDPESYRVPALPLTRGAARSARAGVSRGLVRAEHPVRGRLAFARWQRAADRLAGAYRRISRGTAGCSRCSIRSRPRASRDH